MITGYITLEESTIRSFIRDPEYAEHLLSVVKADGDAEEIAHFQALYDEAKKRSRNEALKISYPSRLAVNSKFATAGAMA